MNEPMLIKNERYDDDRGYLRPLYKAKDLPDTLFFVEDRISVSKLLVLRGLHGDSHTWKLITCIDGIIDLIIVDARKESPNYGENAKLTLSPYGPSILVPPRFLNGHLVTSRQAILHYKWSDYYSGPENQVTVKWNDKDLKINWGYNIGNDFLPILSERDKNGSNFTDIEL